MLTAVLMLCMQFAAKPLSFHCIWSDGMCEAKVDEDFPPAFEIAEFCETHTCGGIPEPMDVPAAPDGDPTMQCHSPCAPDATVCISSVVCENVQKYTCQDKHRVLLSSEDGKKHCILFRGDSQ